MNPPLSNDEGIRTRLLWDDMKKAERCRLTMLIVVILVIILAIGHLVVGIMQGSVRVVIGSVLLGSVLLGIAIGHYDNYNDQYVRLRKKLEDIK